MVPSDPGTSTPAGGTAPIDDRGPFQGLGFYTEADAKWFFGRTAERKIILAHLRTARLTLLYAESGVGKSSLLRAGVAARLSELSARDVDAPGSARYVPIVFNSWKDDPVQALISAINQQVQLLSATEHGETQGASRSGNDQHGNGQSVNGQSVNGLAGAITQAAAALNAPLAIILDQFEEHFTYRLAGAQANDLADELARCVNAASVPANFLIAVREDAYGGLGDLFSGRISNVYNNYLHLEYLTREAARDAIEKPVELYNHERADGERITLDDDLSDAVLDQVRRGNLTLGTRRDRDGGISAPDSASDEIETPFLQLVMTRLWESERAHGSRTLRRSTLEEELGGAQTIVRNHVDRALAGLDPADLDTATDVFRELVTPSGMKVAHTAEDLGQMTGHPQDTVVRVLRRLYEERIVRAVDPAPGTAAPRYELFHDRLAAPILDWRDQQENSRLERAKQRAELEAQTQRAQARRFRRRAQVMFALAMGLLIALLAVVLLLRYARNQSATARREKQAALVENAEATSLALSTRAQSQLASRPDIALLLSLAAHRGNASASELRTALATLRQLQSAGTVGILHGHMSAVNGVAFSPVGPVLASVSGDRTIRLWSVGRAGHRPLGSPLRAPGPLFSVAFAPDGRTLATGSFNKVILWNVTRRAEQTTIPFGGGAITSVALSGRGNMLAAAGSDGTVLLWNTVTHARTRLIVAQVPVRSVAFSPDGAMLAASKGEGIAIYDVGGGQLQGRALTGAPGTVFSVAFSRDGNAVAAGHQSGAIDLWNVADGTRRTLQSDLGLVNSIAFSPDGGSLVAGAGATTVFNLTNGRPSEVLNGGQGGVNSVAFSADGTLLASAGVDGTVKLWSYPVPPGVGKPLAIRPGGTTRVAISADGRLIASGGQDGHIYVFDRAGRLLRTLPGETATVTDVAFAPVGHAVAASYADGAILLWNAASGSSLDPPLHAPGGSVYAVAFDPTGSRLASGQRDGTVRLWNVRSGSEIGPALRRDFGAVFAVAFSPDGARIASGGEGRVIRLWNARTLRPFDPPVIAQDPVVYSLAFSPNGRFVASGESDDTIRVFDGTRGYRLVHTLTGHTSFVRSVAFGPDGTILASSSSDDTVRLWDVATGTELGRPQFGHLKSVESIAFGPTGTFVLSGSPDGTVRRWPAVTLPSSLATLRAQVCSFLGAGLSGAEWRRYAPNISFRPTCPVPTPS